MHTLKPPDKAVEHALDAARQSPCAKSKRGVSAYIFDTARDGRLFSKAFFNGPAAGFCDASDFCKASCSKRCVHAEMRAVRSLTCPELFCLVHVKVDENGKLLAGHGPSCWQCSREILDAKIEGVWLYEQTPSNWCPHEDVVVTACLLCQGEACQLCPPSAPFCEHDVLDRHGDLPLVPARWRYYPAAEFHRRSLETCSIYNPESKP